MGGNKGAFVSNRVIILMFVVSCFVLFFLLVAGYVFGVLYNQVDGGTLIRNETLVVVHEAVDKSLGQTSLISAFFSEHKGAFLIVVYVLVLVVSVVFLVSLMVLLYRKITFRSQDTSSRVSVLQYQQEILSSDKNEHNL